MPEDRSLDEFAADPSVTDVAPAGDDGDDPVTGDAGADVTPATTTSAWTAAGERCEGCGNAASRLWKDDGGLVCPDCKAW